MDIRTIDQNYEQLRGQGEQTVRLIKTLAEKLQTAASDGDNRAREWLLDLREITLGFQQEQNQVGLLLQSIHDHVANQNQQPPQYRQPQYQQPQYQQPQYQQPQYQQPVYQQPPYYQQPYYGGGGFLGSSFGQAIAAGAGFAIGEDIIDDLFF